VPAPFGGAGFQPVSRTGKMPVPVIAVTHDVRVIEGFDSVYHLKDGHLNHNH
jgi:ABC-type lipoprotein export system ATPase subunit